MNAAEKMRIDAQEQTEIMLPLFPGIEDYPWEGGGYFNSLYMRFHLAPPGISVISIPCALSSSRMRSASAKFFAFFAS